MKKLVAVFVFVLAAAFGVDRSPQAAAWWSHIEYLASDALEGRKAGTPGHTKAANYVSSQFDALGLKPGGDDNSFIQRVSMETRLIDESASSLEFVEGGKARVLKLGEEANLGIGIDAPGMIDAPVVFVGHGLKVAEANIDDLAGLDLKGKIAFYLSGAPAHIPAPLAAHSQSMAVRWQNLRAAGAIGIMAFADPNTSDIPWSRSTLNRLSPVVRLTEPALIDNSGVKITVGVNPAHADLFFSGTGHTANEILEFHRANKPLPRFPLKGSIRAKTTFTAKATTSENVIGILPGSSKETVIISAHLDHLGVGGAINGDSIYNGAMDNASGIASVLEVAKALKQQKLKRTVVFLAATGEEGGLMGSKHFAAHPAIAGVDIVADINLDMFLPIIPLKAVTVYGFDESDMGAEFATIAAKHQIEAERDPEPQRNLFIRSDQYSFIRKGIPALSFKFYARPGTPDAAVFKEWTAKRYHAPSDDLNQPVDAEAAVRFNRVMADFIQHIANRDARPQWKKDSFFQRYASK